MISNIRISFQLVTVCGHNLSVRVDQPNRSKQRENAAPLGIAHGQAKQFFPDDLAVVDYGVLGSEEMSCPGIPTISKNDQDPFVRLAA